MYDLQGYHYNKHIISKYHQTGAKESSHTQSRQEFPSLMIHQLC